MIISILTTGCSDPVIDATTDKTKEASVAKIGDSLSDTERAVFKKAVNTILRTEMKRYSRRNALSANQSNGSSIDKALREAIHGKTANQIIEQAETINPLLREEIASEPLHQGYNTVIDATTHETTASTIRAIKRSLSGAESAQFEKDIQLVLAYHIDINSLLNNPDFQSIIKERRKTAIHGKTAKEIQEEAKTIRKNRDRDNFYINMDDD
ncbi:MAG: hypothetical protein OEW87_12990 [Flavobacteriaceae bacterium]|nr:hypothetical protein [Flavobacteriaceae bacterium]